MELVDQLLRVAHRERIKRELARHNKKRRALIRALRQVSKEKL